MLALRVELPLCSMHHGHKIRLARTSTPRTGGGTLPTVKYQEKPTDPEYTILFLVRRQVRTAVVA